MASVSTTFVIARHGQTPMNLAKQISGGGSNPELTDVGKKEAAELAVMLQERHSDICDTIISSDLERAIQTAAIVMERWKDRAIKVKLNRNFQEIQHGKSEGMPAVDRDRAWKVFVEQQLKEDPTRSKDPFFKWKISPFEAQGAETFLKLYERISSALVELAQKFPGKKVCIVAHNAVMQALIMRTLIEQGKLRPREDGMYPLFFEHSLLGNCSIAVFTCDPTASGVDRVQFVKLEEPKKVEKKEEKEAVKA